MQIDSRQVGPRLDVVRLGPQEDLPLLLRLGVVLQGEVHLGGFHREGEVEIGEAKPLAIVLAAGLGPDDLLAEGETLLRQRGPVARPAVREEAGAEVEEGVGQVAAEPDDLGMVADERLQHRSGLLEERDRLGELPGGALGFADLDQGLGDVGRRFERCRPHWPGPRAGRVLGESPARPHPDARSIHSARRADDGPRPGPRAIGGRARRRAGPPASGRSRGPGPAAPCGSRRIPTASAAGRR